MLKSVMCCSFAGSKEAKTKASGVLYLHRAGVYLMCVCMCVCMPYLHRAGAYLMSVCVLNVFVCPICTEPVRT